jgi:hypothetical protein
MADRARYHDRRKNLKHFAMIAGVSTAGKSLALDLITS